MMLRSAIYVMALIIAQAATQGGARAEAQEADVMKMAVTTSFYNSGLAEVILPAIRHDLDLEVQILVVGTGQAIKLGAAGDVDAILVHSRSAEEAFIAEGRAPHRREVMYNDFVFIGPKDDPAAIGQASTAVQALQSIVSAEALFVSRGDDSGTHRKEQALWRSAGQNSQDFGAWYRAVGAGMGTALNIASGMNAYILSDRASWLNFGNKGDLALLFSGDLILFNQYSYLPVSPDLHPHIKYDLALKLENWLVSDRAKALINGHRINGEALFVFNATAP